MSIFLLDPHNTSLSLSLYVHIIFCLILYVCLLNSITFRGPKKKRTIDIMWYFTVIINYINTCFHFDPSTTQDLRDAESSKIAKLLDESKRRQAAVESRYAEDSFGLAHQWISFFLFYYRKHRDIDIWIYMIIHVLTQNVDIIWYN